jgi:hypothetical protein
MSYVQGTVVRVSAVFTDTNTGAPVDPPEVVLRVERPGQEVEQRTLGQGGVINDPTRTGGFYADLDTEDGPPGTWKYQFESSGATQVTARKALTVRSRI